MTKAPAAAGPAGDHRIQVAYTMPVEVVVNLKTGKVEKAVTIEEGLVRDEDTGVRWVDNGKLAPVEDDGLAAQAIAIAGCQAPHASAEAGWPTWESGM